MNRIRLIALAAVAAVVAIAAVVLSLNEREEAALSGGKLFPELEARINDINALTVQLSREETLSLQRSDDQWLVAEKAGYPANLAQLRKVLLALARTEKLEQKTSKPEYYERLGVQDMNEAGDDTRLLRVSAGNLTLAEVIIGKSGAGGKSYLRPANQPVSWLGSEWIDVPGRVNAWLDAQLLAIKPERIRAVEVVHADGVQLRIEKDGDRLKLLGDGDSELPAKAEELERVAATLSSLSLQDIVDDVESDESSWRSTRFMTSDGLTIAAQTLSREDQLLARLTAEIHGDSPSEDLQQEAQSLNERFGGRTFVLASYLDERFAPTLDVLQEQPAETTEQ